MLGNRVAMMDANLVHHLEAEVGYFDLQDGDRYYACGKTTAWNWHMGCQLQWLVGEDGLQFIYNVRRDSTDGVYTGFGSAIYNAAPGSREARRVGKEGGGT